MLLHPPLVTAAEMRELESQAFAAGIAEEALMDEAGAGLGDYVRKWLPLPGSAVVFAGKGHNAGDAFVLAGHLLAAGWKVQVRLTFPEETLRPLAARKLAAIRDRVDFAGVESATVPAGRPLLLVDGLLGIGAEGTLRGAMAGAVRAINELRQREHALTLAVDLPSGLGGDSTPVVADVTLTLGWPKDLLFADEAAVSTGRLVSVPLTGLPLPGQSSSRDGLVTAAGLRHSLLPRPPFAKHKGQSGRIGIVAGSVGLTGAARLAATAAAALGGGLVTLFCPRSVYDILAASCPPEVMVRPVASCQEVRDFPLDSIGIGPGLGAAPLPLLADLVWNDPRPVIVDADALNAFAVMPGDGRVFAGPRLFTPHPGELARLVRKWCPAEEQSPRRRQAFALTEVLGITLLAKSARSFVLGPGRPAAWNGSGHPLMARGGMGDVLTGFLTTLSAQGMPLYEAAALGSWLLGRGAELYHATTGWEEPGLASEVIRHAAGEAMAGLRAGK
jgi:hydroxyethylthiazole kinase-like uncharacterized protein yjeF